MASRRASSFFAGLSPTPRHSIAEPELSILGREITPDSACVKALPLASALPLHLCWANRYEKLGVAIFVPCLTMFTRIDSILTAGNGLQ